MIREDCLESVKSLNFADVDCVIVTARKVTGYTIVTLASIVKVPQILKVLSAQSAKGLVQSMYYVECWMNAIVMCYNIHLNNSFSLYGETVFLLLQNLILISLIWQYSQTISTSEKISFTLATTALITYLYTDVYVPTIVWDLAMSCQFVLMGYARIPQIIANYAEKSTGQMSVITFVANFLGVIARALTYGFRMDLMFASLIMNILYNGALVFQIFTYWHNTAEDTKESGAKIDSDKGTDTLKPSSKPRSNRSSKKKID